MRRPPTRWSWHLTGRGALPRSVRDAQSCRVGGGRIGTRERGQPRPTAQQTGAAAAAAFEPLVRHGYVSAPCRWPDCVAYSNRRWRIEVSHDWKEGALLVRVGEYTKTGTADPGHPAMRSIDELLPAPAMAGLRLGRLKPDLSTGMLASRLRGLVQVLTTGAPDLLRGPDPVDTTEA